MTGDMWFVLPKQALTISKEEGADDFICEMVALLHDVANEKLNASEAEGLAKLINFLDSQSLPAEVVEQVLVISFKVDHNQVALSLEDCSRC